jgi:predicted 3-demethylubiquinone-9 3-methyltransferase (glyoxalase superfamily)
MQKITPFLWFNSNAEEAVNFYTSIFKNSKVGTITRYGEAGPGPKGSLMTASFTLEGQEFVALNGGPVYQFTPAISFVVNCETQAEVDYYWDKLAADGREVQCGWVTDKFGVSWQVVPTALFRLLSDKDPAKVKRVMEAMFQMIKLDLPKLQEAYDKA